MREILPAQNQLNLVRDVCALINYARITPRAGVRLRHGRLEVRCRAFEVLRYGTLTGMVSTNTIATYRAILDVCKRANVQFKLVPPKRREPDDPDVRPIAVPETTPETISSDPLPLADAA